jgi:hypothetical protein
MMTTSTGGWPGRFALFFEVDVMTRSIRQLAFPSRIIGALLVVWLAGCSAVKLGYDNAPALTYWWLDSYVDFNSTQAPAVRANLASLHAWHRKNELPAYADTVRRLQARASGDVTPAQVCDISAEIQAHMRRLAEAAAAGISAFTPTVRPEQLQHLALQFEKHSEKWRDEWMDPPPAEISKKRLKLAVERAETFYGDLDQAQLAILREGIARSSFDARLSYREILRRQRDILQVLEEHGTAGTARGAHVQAEVLALLERLRDSPDPTYHAQQEKMLREGCANLAALHNSTSKTQRARLLETLREYEADVRALSSEKD